MNPGGIIPDPIAVDDTVEPGEVLVVTGYGTRWAVVHEHRVLPGTIGGLCAAHLGRLVELPGTVAGILRDVKHEDGGTWIGLANPADRHWRYFAKHEASRPVRFPAG